MNIPSFLRSRLDTFGPLLGLLFVFGLFCLSPEVRSSFLTVDNTRIILTQTVIVAVAALGMTLIIASGGIDLSVGSVIALVSVVGARALEAGTPPGTACLLMVLCGMAVGFINGGLIAGFRLMPFIVTLGMLGVARGAAKWSAHEQTVTIPDTWINTLMQPFPEPAWIQVSAGVWVAVLLSVLALLVLNRTVFGRHIYALGSNESAARLCGVPIAPTKIAIYTLAGAFFGVAGAFQLARLQQGDPSVAVGVELDVIAAVVIGGASLSGGTGSIAGSLIGALIMAVLRNGSQQIGWPTYIQEIMIGGVIVLAVGLDRWRHGRKE
jgi:ribose transport system permease protein